MNYIIIFNILEIITSVERIENDNIDYVKRGNITDHTGIILAESIPGFQVSLYSNKAHNLHELIQKIKRDFNISSYDLSNLISQWKENPVPLSIIDYDQKKYIDEKYKEEPGIQIEKINIRHYPYGNIASHIIGYIERNKNREEKPHISWHGASGIEYTYENYLKNGNNIALSIDIELQIKIERYLSDARAGGIVIVDPITSHIIAMASRPNFDPNILSKTVPHRRSHIISKLEDTSLINRTLQITYPMGSVFKIITAISAMDNGTAQEDTIYNCNGKWRPSESSRWFKCHNEDGHGSLNLPQAVSQSCNIYFYKLALETGINALVETAERFGLGKKSGIDLPWEKTGLLPNASFRKKRLGPWYPGETMLFGIGQGPMAVTLIQVSGIFQALAAHGNRRKPSVTLIPAYLNDYRKNEQNTDDNDYLTRDTSTIKSIHKTNPADKTYKENRYTTTTIESNTTNTIEEEITTLNPMIDEIIIKKGLNNVTKGKGTAKDAFIGYTYGEITAKTGTAEIINAEKKTKHAWFSAYAPSQKPEIIVVILIEDADSGAHTAAPIGRKILEAFFAEKNRRQKKS